MMRRSTCAAVALILAALVVEGSASAAPSVRASFDVYGDAISIGSTLGWDCGSGLTPPTGATVDCTGETATTSADKAPDIYWQDGAASKLVAATSARTSATLTLPSGATVVGARLYWAALLDGTTVTPPTPDASVLFGKAGSDATVTSTTCVSLPSTGPLPSPAAYIVYQCSADVSSVVTSSGEYRVSDVSGTLLNGVVASNAFSGWTLVVVYSHAGDVFRHVTLLDGLDFLDGTAGTSSSVSPSGFKFSSGGSAELTIWGWTGGAGITGDFVKVGSTTLTSTNNPADDFFDATRTRNGALQAGTVPALDGSPKSMAGLDLDAVDLSSVLTAGATTYAFSAGSTGDTYFLGGLVSSIQSAAPKLDVTKTFTDLDGTKVVPGDTLEFTLTTTNNGDDDAAAVVLRDALPSGLTFVAGSITIDAAAKTDAVDTDQAEFVTPNLTARLGTGADGTSGGTLAVGASTTVKFRTTVSAAPGTTTNQAFVNSHGASGAPATDSASDGDSVTAGAQATSIVVVECQGTRGCTGGKVCDDGTNLCVDSLDAGSDTGGGDTSGADTASGDTASGDTASSDAGTDGGVDSGAGGDTSADTTTGADSTTGADTATSSDSSTGSDTTTTSDTSSNVDGSQDGTLVTDSGTGGSVDSGKIPDADLITEGSGCACTTPHGDASSSEAAFLALGLGAIAIAARRRR